MGFWEWCSMHTTEINVGIIVVYMAAVIGIGFLFNEKNETTENYLLGGRNMSWLPVGLSLMMTLLSSISLVQVPGEIYNHGFTMMVLNVPCLLLFPLYYLLFVKFYFKLGSYTPYEYLERRYDKTVRTIVVISAFYGRIIYLGMVLFTTSKIFEGAYGWPSWLTISIVGVCGGIYTVLGGMKAVVWTDVIQFFVLTLGFIVILVLLNNRIDGGLIGGVVYAWKNGCSATAYATKEFYTLTPYIRLCFWLLLWNCVIAGVGSMSSDQFTIQRVLATKDWKEGYKAQWLSTWLGIGSTVVLWIIGFCVFTYFKQLPSPDPIMTAAGERPGDIAFFRFITLEAPTPIPGLFMAAMLAAIMSTLDSGMNSMATIWVKEFHSRFIRKNMTDAEELKVSKWATIIVGVVIVLFGLGLSWSQKWLQQSVTEVGTLFGWLGACTLPAFLFAVLSKRANATLIWVYTIFATGEAICSNFWYAASRTAVQAWKKDPSVGMGWGGPLDIKYVLIPLLIGLILLLPTFFKRTRKELTAKIAMFTGVVFLGIAGRGMIWWGFSNWLITDTPKEMSFAFGLPFSLIISFIVLWFCPVQPEKKWRGLTFSTVNDKIIED